MATKHGIAVRNRKTKVLVQFVECSYGSNTLRMLSGVRMNLHKDFDAQEDIVEEEEIKLIKERQKVVERLS